MRIIHLAAGAGTMYCGACAHDATLVRGLLKRGHEVTVMPLYTPLRVDADGVLPTTPVFLGGINAYLQQRFRLFRRTPAFIERLLDNEGLLRWASTFAVKTAPSQLGAMTVSVLKGIHGYQAGEVERLFTFIESGLRPDLVSITNTLLSFVAPMLKERLGVPVACLFQGEDGFVEAMGEPYAAEVAALMQGNARAVDLFLAPSEVNARKMEGFLKVPPEKVRMVRVGIEAEPFAGDDAPPEPFSIGYLSVITKAKGLDMLVDAFIGLADEHPDVMLRIAGRALDKEFLGEQRTKVQRAGLAPRVRYLGELPFAEKVRFLRDCSLFCLPSRIDESRGVAALEAMASARPIVVPASGVFPEMLGLTEGGWSFAARSTESLIATLRRLLADRQEAGRAGHRARAGVREHFSAQTMIDQTARAYESLVG